MEHDSASPLPTAREGAGAAVTLQTPAAAQGELTVTPQPCRHHTSVLPTGTVLTRPSCWDCRTASAFLSCPSDIHRAAPLLRQCVLQGQAQAVYRIQGKEVRVPVQLIPYVVTLVRTWCCSNGSGSYKKKLISLRFSKKENHISLAMAGTSLNTSDLVPVAAHQHRRFPSRTGWRWLASSSHGQGLSCSRQWAWGAPVTCQNPAALLPRANIIILTNG